ncbi:hypothetical protein INT45_010254 [Circinella minor]|uniref:SAP domain-containing protein n=1 Tax=Circinella minor TaxID=1195481 RepID=A0A8H7RUT1_9FUNG|nr:hypothetical protein INT45_010254 [Circinella minor]
MLPEDLSKLRVVDLKKELTERSLSTKGKKDELVARLQEWVDENNKDQVAGQNDQQQQEEQPQKAEESQPEPPLTTNGKDSKENDSQQILSNEQQQQEVVEAESTESVVQQPPQPETTVVEKEPTESAAPAPETETETAQAEPMEEDGKSTEQPATPIEEEKPVEDTKPEKEEKVEEKKEEESTTEPIEEDSEIKGTKRKRLEGEAEKSPEKRSKAATTEEEEQQEQKTEKEQEEQQQPGSTDVTSSAIYIKGFVRPLIIKHVQELISQYGTVKRFWMDAIKTHCYVIYESEKEAKDAYSGIDGIVFPRDTGRQVKVGGLTPEQAEILIGQEQAAASKRMKLDWEKAIDAVIKGEVLESSPGSSDQQQSGETRRHRLSGIGQITRELQKAATASVIAPTSSLPSNVEERSVHLVQTDASSGKLEQQEEPSKSSIDPLDELFKKTTALPHLYYLPISESIAKQRLEKMK